MPTPSNVGMRRERGSCLFREVWTPFPVPSGGVASRGFSRQRPEGSRPSAFILHFSIFITHFPIVAEGHEPSDELRGDRAFSERSGRHLGFHYAALPLENSHAKNRRARDLPLLLTASNCRAGDALPSPDPARNPPPDRCGLMGCTENREVLRQPCGIRATVRPIL